MKKWDMERFVVPGLVGVLAFVIFPLLDVIIFTAPSGCNIVRITNNDTNCGIAMDKININLQNPFAFVFFLLITIAKIIPKI